MTRQTLFASVRLSNTVIGLENGVNLENGLHVTLVSKLGDYIQLCCVGKMLCSLPPKDKFRENSAWDICGGCLFGPCFEGISCWKIREETLQAHSSKTRKQMLSISILSNWMKRNQNIDWYNTYSLGPLCEENSQWNTKISSTEDVLDSIKLRMPSSV